MHFCVYYCFSHYRLVKVLHLIYQTDQKLLLILLNIIESSHLTVTWCIGAVIKGGSKVDFRLIISASFRVKLPNCNQDIVSKSANFGHHLHFLHACRFWNTSQKVPFQVAILLGWLQQEWLELSSKTLVLMWYCIIFSLKTCISTVTQCIAR